MSGIGMMMLASSFAYVVTPLNLSASNSAIGTGSSTAAVNFVTDGSTNATHVSVGPSWYLPNTAGVGAGYWIRFTTATYTGLWLNLGTGQGISATGGNVDITYNFAIATDSAGVTVVGTGTVQLTTANGL